MGRRFWRTNNAAVWRDRGPREGDEQCVDDSNHCISTCKDRVVPNAPPGLQLQNRFGELVVEEDDNDEEDGIPIMALFSPETEIDSGAAESVAPVQMAPWVPRQESEGSKRGQTYLSASGEKLPNMGEKKFDMVTSEGNWAQATFQVAEVTRPLCSVSKMWCLSLVEATWSTSRAGQGRDSPGRIMFMLWRCTCRILDVIPRRRLLAGRGCEHKPSWVPHTCKTGGKQM